MDKQSGLDSRAFSNVYDELLDEKRYDYMAKVKPAAESGKHGVFNGIMNTAPGIVNIGMGDKYANQSVHIIGYAKTSRTELLHFTVGGKRCRLDGQTSIHSYTR